MSGAPHAARGRCPAALAQPSATPHRLRCWVLCEQHAGMLNQCVGLAEALGVAYSVTPVRPRWPWVWLPPRLWRPALLASGVATTLRPPWPELVISCGRRSVAAAMAVRRASRGRSFTVHIQDPHVASRHFDLVVVPEHDGLRGTNCLLTRGALHRVTPARVHAAAVELAPRVAHLPRPLVGVLVGGSSRHHTLTAAAVDRLAVRLREFARRHDAGLLVTPSRRTGEANTERLRRALGEERAWVWNGAGANPYFGIIGLAEALVVTSDSVSMVSEACATGRPVYVYELEGMGRRLRRFHHALRAAGVTRPFTGELERWQYPPLDDTERVARAVRARLRSAA